MLYIREEKDIEIFINNMISTFPNKKSITNPVVQLIYVILQFLVYNTRPNDDDLLRNIAKLLNVFEDGAFDIRGPFNIIFTDLSMKDSERAQKTYRNYILFRDMCQKDGSIDLTEVAATAKQIVEEHVAGLSPDILLRHLRNPNVPRHTTVKTEDGTKYEFYFFYNSGTNIKVANVERNDKDNCITASVWAIHPFLYNFDNKPSVNKKFLQQVICICNEKLEKEQIELEWVVENAFKDDYDIDLDSINEYDPNEKFKKASKKGICKHEAGHAVIDWLFDRKIESVTVQRDEKWGGSEEPKLNIRHSSTFEHMLPNMISSYAGDLAKKSNREKFIYWTAEGATKDVKEATNFAKQYVADTVYALDQRCIDYESLGVNRTFWVAYKTSLLCEYVYKCTEEIVKANHDLIDALAAELYEKKTMNGAEINACLRAIDPTRKGSLLSILPEEEKTINAILNPYSKKEGYNL